MNTSAMKNQKLVCILYIDVVSFKKIANTYVYNYNGSQFIDAGDKTELIAFHIFFNFFLIDRVIKP